MLFALKLKPENFKKPLFNAIILTMADLSVVALVIMLAFNSEISIILGAYALICYVIGIFTGRLEKKKE
jgi:glucose uptake protein GlcU